MQTGREPLALEAQAGYLWTWWKHDPLPMLPPLPGWHIEIAEDSNVLTQILEVSREDMVQRWRKGHRLYLAYLETTLVAYGWSAINEAVFGAGVQFEVPTNNLYLYDFVTLPLWRGHSFYPRLLQEILLRETNRYERFWIIHQLANVASQRGIAKAGFCIAASVFYSVGGKLILFPDANLERARVGAALLGLFLIE
jgi:GNAT superfamily N-acetyltransferase